MLGMRNHSGIIAQDFAPDKNNNNNDNNSNNNNNNNDDDNNNNNNININDGNNNNNDDKSEQSDTTALDKIAIVHVGLCVFPLLFGSAEYSLLYFAHRSWWSWGVNALVDVVYLAGFVSLTPQLYINYKLKSVAHLPMKAFMYKAFNTFIDDVYSVIVKMPMKHRIMTLRDDVIFLVFIYQVL